MSLPPPVNRPVPVEQVKDVGSKVIATVLLELETLVLSKRHFATMTDLSDVERDLLGEILRKITARYDNLFQTSFPYSMGFHQAPTDGNVYPEWHFHAHYYPPLLRSATTQKFMVGYEMLCSPQRDITPETAGQRLIQMTENLPHVRC
jgi:UDPglucose--hexose-1-phosphate uridylyltransferase